MHTTAATSRYSWQAITAGCERHVAECSRSEAIEVNCSSQKIQSHRRPTSGSSGALVGALSELIVFSSCPLNLSVRRTALSATSRDRRLVRLVEPDFGGVIEIAEDDVGIPIAVEIAADQRLRVAGGECRAFLEAALAVVEPDRSWRVVPTAGDGHDVEIVIGVEIHKFDRFALAAAESLLAGLKAAVTVVEPDAIAVIAREEQVEVSVPIEIAQRHGSTFVEFEGLFGVRVMSLAIVEPDAVVAADTGHHEIGVTVVVQVAQRDTGVHGS